MASQSPPPTAWTSAEDEDGGSFAARVALLRRRKWLVLSCVLLAVAGSVVVSLLQPKEYTASASLLFRDPGFDEQLLGESLAMPPGDAARQAATNVRLVSLDVVAERTARTLGLSLTRVSDATDVRAEGSSNVVSVSAVDEVPSRAVLMANTFAREFVRFRREADQAKIRAARAVIRRRIAEAPQEDGSSSESRVLERRAEVLETLEALQTGNAELAQSALRPTAPTSPKPLRNGIVALFFGTLLGLLAAVLTDRLDQRLRSKAEVQNLMGGPVLGLIPEDPSLSRPHTGLTRGTGPAEAVQMLRANLRYLNVNGRLRSLAITSAAAGEGKTMISWSLSVAAAQAGQRVLLMEADFSHPALDLADGPSGGLSGVLAGDISLEEASLEVPVIVDGSGQDATSTPLRIIQAGPIPPNPVELLGSSLMTHLLRRAESEFDLIIIDTAPVGVVADAVPLLKEANGVLIVSRLGVSERSSTERLRDTLEILGVPILGLVVNSVPDQRSYRSS